MRSGNVCSGNVRSGQSQRQDRRTPTSAGRCTRVLHDSCAQNMTARDANGLSCPSICPCVAVTCVAASHRNNGQTPASAGRCTRVLHKSRAQNMTARDAYSLSCFSIWPCVSVRCVAVTCVAVSHKDNRQTPTSAGRCTRVLHDSRAQNMTARDANDLSCLYLAVRSGNVRSGQSQRQRTDAGFGRALYQSPARLSI